MRRSAAGQYGGPWGGMYLEGQVTKRIFVRHAKDKGNHYIFYSRPQNAVSGRLSCCHGFRGALYRLDLGFSLQLQLHLVSSNNSFGGLKG